jgi:hypothetical protein
MPKRSPESLLTILTNHMRNRQKRPCSPDVNPGSTKASTEDPRISRCFIRATAMMQLWLFWVTPIIGGVIGALMYKTINVAKD